MDESLGELNRGFLEVLDIRNMCKIQTSLPRPPSKVLTSRICGEVDVR